VATVISLAELVDRGEHDDHPHSPTSHATRGALEWLGLAVGELPYLTSSARTVDDLNWGSRAPNAAGMNLAMIDALGQQLASAAALLNRALVAQVQAYPERCSAAAVQAEVDVMSQTLLEDHPPLSRRADLLLGAYATALAGAVQASGRPGSEAVVCESTIRALATLLGHARLNDRDRNFVARKAA
jgi:hypothetical protein